MVLKIPSSSKVLFDPWFNPHSNFNYLYCTVVNHISPNWNYKLKLLMLDPKFLFEVIWWKSFLAMTAVNYQPLLVLWKDLWKGYSSFLPSLFILKKICLNNISRVFHCNICTKRFYKIIKTDTIFPFTLSPISLAR